MARCLTPFWQILIGLAKKAQYQLSFHWFPQIFVAYKQKTNIKVCVNLQIILSGLPKSLLSTSKKQRTKFTYICKSFSTFRLPQIYDEFYHTVNNADHDKDLRWWSNTHGVNMPMAWPQFEVSLHFAFCMIYLFILFVFS